MQDKGGKKCNWCLETKALSEFGKNQKSADGFSFYCKQCVNADTGRRYRLRRAAAGKSVRDRGAERLERGPAPAGQKWCPDCEDFRPVAEFPRNRSTPDGLAGYCKPHQNARTYESRQRVHGGSRHYHLVRRYGISAAEVEQQIQWQAGLCPICLTELGAKPHVDHDHETGEVRGVLCFNCNGGLGQFRDEPFLLTRAAAYLTGTMETLLAGDNGNYRVSAQVRRPAS